MNIFVCIKAAVIIIAAAGVAIGIYRLWRDLHEDY